MWILGLSLSHNGAVALINEGTVVCAIQAERLSRVKRQALRIPDNNMLISECIDYVCDEAEIDKLAIQAVAITSPWHVSEIACEELADAFGLESTQPIDIHHVPHHLAHAEYALHYQTDQDVDTIILVIDGSGSFERDRDRFTAIENHSDNAILVCDPDGKEVISCYHHKNGRLSLVYRYSPSNLPDSPRNKNSRGLIQSIGHYWRWASWYCCGGHNDAGKVMGLAALAKKNTLPESYAHWSLETGLEIDFDGLYRDFADPNFLGKDIAGNEEYRSVAGLLQKDTDRIILDLLQYLQSTHQADHLCYAGGVALNVVTNEKIFRSGIFEQIVLNGSCEDNGTAIGAALAASSQLESSRKPEAITDYYGKTYGNDFIAHTLEQMSVSHQKLDDDTIFEHAARNLAAGKVIGWFHGRSEFGPRALGNRSILADPRHSSIKTLLDVRMKQRDRYRPYAPAVLKEAAEEYFDLMGESPVMMREANVRSDALPAITHADNSARVQTVSKTDNAHLHKLISAFRDLTGTPVLLNTSFNQPGEPIVETPADAVSSYLQGHLDCLYLESFFIENQAR